MTLLKNPTRRRVLRVIAGGIVSLLAASCAGLPSPHPGASSASSASAWELLYIGSHEDQVLAGWFDSRRGELRNIAPVAQAVRPNWAIQDDSIPVLYLAHGDPEGTVQSFAIDHQTGALEELSRLSTGAGVSHIQFDRVSRTLLAANYGAGHVAAVAVTDDGRLDRVTSIVALPGSGPNPRQASAHPHGVLIDPDGRHVLVPDFGADRVFVLDFDRAAQRLSWRGEEAAYTAPRGSAPRHAVLGRDGRHLYVLNELTAILDVLRWDSEGGDLQLVASYPTNSEGFLGRTSAAEIDISPDGRFVYTSNRGENTIVVFEVNQLSGLLQLAQRINSGGDFPWTFAIHGTGAWLLVANANSNSLAVFAIDRQSGLLSLHDNVSDVPNPHSLSFIISPPPSTEPR